MTGIPCPSCSVTGWYRIRRDRDRVWFGCYGCNYTIGLADEVCLALGIPLERRA